MKYKYTYVVLFRFVHYFIPVQWSTSPIFDVYNERIFAANPQNFKFTIPDLESNSRYFFRAMAGNIKDWSPLSSFSLCCANRKVLDKVCKNRDLQKKHLENLCLVLQKINVDSYKQYLEMEKGQKKRNAIHSLFNSVSANKFHKTMKRGLYMACVLFSTDKSIFVIDDCIPIVEVCDVQTTIASTDFIWLMKLSYSWFNLKILKASLQQKENGNVSWECRKKILSAIKILQSALNIDNLGQLYHREIRVTDESVLLTFVKHDEQKSAGHLVGKWIQIEKLKKISQFNQISIEDIIKFNENSNSKLHKGLYLGYLSLKSSLNVLYIMTSKANILPHVQIRENPFICAEEWEIISENKVSGINKLYLTEIQLKFLTELQKAVSELLKVLNGQADLADLRFFCLDIIEINENVSFIVVLPKAENFCQVINSKDESVLCTEKITYLPLKVFELIHTAVFQGEIAKKYFELSCTLDLEIQLATQSSREALSATEIDTTKTKLNKLQDVAEACKDFWKILNWMGALIKFAQNKEAPTEPTLRNILECKKSLDKASSSVKSKLKNVTQQYKFSPNKHHHSHSRFHVADQNETDLQANVQRLEETQLETSILQVYAAYDTGLPNGTSLKLRVTPKTTSREVVDLVVKQLNMAVVLKGG